MSADTPLSPFKKMLEETSAKMNEAIKNIESNAPFSPGGFSKSQHVFDVSFTEKKLGLTLQRGVFSGRPVVVSVEQNTAGARGGIVVGDEIISIAGGHRSGFPTTPINIDSYDKFMKLFPKHNRPVIIKFCRPPRGSKPSYIKQSPSPMAGDKQANSHGSPNDDTPSKLKQLLLSLKNSPIARFSDFEDVELSSGAVNEHIDSSNLLVATAAAHAASVIQKNSSQLPRSQISHVINASRPNPIDKEDVCEKDSIKDEEKHDSEQQILGFHTLKGKSGEEIKEELREKALQAADALKRQGKEIEDKLNDVKEKFSFWIEKTKENLETGDWRSESSSSLHGNEDQGGEESDVQKSFRLKCDSEEYEMQRIKEQSKRQWKNLTLEHLERFVVAHPKATYEDWLCELHPKMSSWKNEKGEPDADLIDDHFYHMTCDYLGLWNRVASAHKNTSFIVAARANDNIFNKNKKETLSGGLTGESLSSSDGIESSTSQNVSFFIDNNKRDYSYQDQSYDQDYDLDEGATSKGNSLDSQQHTAAEIARQVSDALSLAFADSDSDSEEGDAFM